MGEAYDPTEPLRVPPHSQEAETSVLGALLLDAAAWDHVGDLLTEADFYRHDNRAVFGAVAALANQHKPVDVVTVFEALQRSGKAEEVGGLVYLNSLAQFLPSVSSIRRHAEIVRDCAVLRRLVAASDEIASAAFSRGDNSVADVLNAAQQRIFDIAAVRGSREVVSVGQVVKGYLEHIQDLSEGRKEPGVKTRIPSLDWRLGGGLKDGKLVVVAARPSVGKTALALQFAKAFFNEGIGAAVFSMEMERQELIDRLVSNMGEIDLGRLTTGKLDQADWSSMTIAVEKIARMDMFIDDQPSLTAGELMAKARKLKRTQSIGLVVVDYLQLMAPSAGKTKDSRHHQIEEISRSMKTLAKHLGVPVVLLSQLSREVEKRTNKRATLADLKESGAIEEDADVVILLSDDNEELSTGAKVIHCEVAKNRGGQKGWMKLAFEGRYQRFSELARTEDTPTRKVAKPSYAEDF